MAVGPPGSPPYGPGAGDEPIRGRWGFRVAVLFLGGFVGGVAGIYGLVGAPVSLGFGELDRLAVYVTLGAAVLWTLLFVGRFVLAFVSPDVDLL